MLWAKQIKLKNILILLVFCFVFLAPRVPALGRDEINPDGVNWHYRSEQFVVALKTSDFLKTYQHYHPGVTLMWVVGPTVELIKQLNPAERVYDQFNFPVFNLCAKLALVGVQLVLSLLALLFLSKAFDEKKAFFAAALLSLEPFFLGNSRLLHMDVLLTLFLLNGLVLAYLNFKNFSVAKSICSGFFLAMAFLTKSVAIGGILFVLIFSFFSASGFKVSLKRAFLTFLAFVVFTFLFFPALWVSPITVFISIFKEAERIGVRNGHGQIILGEYTKNAGFWFYPLVLVMKLSPITLMGSLIFFVNKFIAFVRNKTCPVKLIKTAKLTLYLGVFYVGYLFLMFFPSKKIDRYMLVIFPFVCLTSVFGLAKALAFLKNSFAKGLFMVSILVGLAYPLVSFFPYYFTYTSPIFGDAQNANKLIVQKPFGIGVFELKDVILENYGYYPNLGFYDTKPMKAIYPNSKVYDVRVNGPGDYDLFILGPDEVIPEKVLGGSYVFEKGRSVYINGLEYWRIYVKKI